MAARCRGASHPSTAQEVTKALQILSVDKTKELVFGLGVTLNDIDDIDSRYDGALGKAHFVQKWLDMDPTASWQKLVTALREINMNTLASEIERTRVARVPASSVLTNHDRESCFYAAKICLTGNSGGGKTSLISQFIYGCIPDLHKPTSGLTVGAGFTVQEFSVCGVRLRLEIWDTAGQERYRSLAPMYLRGAQGIILVYDITCVKSFRDISDWVACIEESAVENAQVVLVGNKIDLDEEQREISREMGEHLAQERGFEFLETSALTGENVADVFECLASQILSKNLAQKVVCNPSTSKRSVCC